MELEGCGASAIAQELGMTAGAVGNILSKAHRQRAEQIAEVIDLHRAIELERSESVLKRFMPLALDEDLFSQIERGELVEAKRMDRAVRSALVVLAVLDFRCRLLGLYPASVRGPRKEEKDETPGWLKTQALVNSAQPALGEHEWDAL
jgi:hypothetical protein